MSATGRVSGAILVAGIGYATYELYSGWTAGEDESGLSSEAEPSDFISDSGVSDRVGDSGSLDGSNLDTEFEDEIDDLLDSEQS